MLRGLGTLSKIVLIMSGVAVTVLLGFIDYATGPDLSFIIFYLFPIAVVTWFAGKWPGILISTISALIWIGSDFMAKASYPRLLIPFWNTVVEFSVFFVVVYIFAMLKTALVREEELNRRLQQNLQKITDLNKELETFNYSVSHDLRTPLIVIGGFTKRLLKKYSSVIDDRGREELDIIQSNVQKMSQLIDDLLAFSRSERQEMRSEVVDMRSLSERVVGELRELMPVTAAIVVKEMPPASGDAAMLHQVIYNLVSNAVKFTRHAEEALIEIGCNSERGKNIYYVKDNGAGFDMKYADKLFGVFQRLHKNEEYEGTGIGLAIVQRIIDRHGGRVWAEGRVNEGATIYFSLPASAQTESTDLGKVAPVNPKMSSAG